MRVLIAHSGYRERGGEDRYVEEQAALLAQEHEVHLFLRSSQGQSGIRVAKALVGRDGRADELADVVRAFRPDLMHLHNAIPMLGPTAHRAAESFGIPLVMTVHNFRLRCPNGFAFTEGHLCERCVGGNHVNGVIHHCFQSGSQAAAYTSALWVQRFVLRTERKVSVFLAISDFMNAKLREWGIPASKIRTVRSFSRAFPAATPQPGTFGLFLGRLSSEKGVDVLLKALADAGDPPFKIVGDGPLLAELLSLKESLGLRNASFAGRLDTETVDQLLLGARFVVMPSLWNEPGGLAAMEAMSAGRPVIVSDRGALPELVHESGGGVVTPARDVARLSLAMLQLYQEDQLCLELAEKALQFARTRLTAETHLTAVEEVYRSILTTKR